MSQYDHAWKKRNTDPQTIRLNTQVTLNDTSAIFIRGRLRACLFLGKLQGRATLLPSIYSVSTILQSSVCVDDQDSQFSLRPIRDKNCRNHDWHHGTYKRYFVASLYLTSEISKYFDTLSFSLHSTWELKEEAKLEVFINKEANNFSAKLSVNSLFR